MRGMPWEGSARARGRSVGVCSLLFAALALAACEQLGGPLPWGVDTVYEIEDIDSGAQRRLERMLRSRGFGFERVDSVEPAAGVATGRSALERERRERYEGRYADAGSGAEADLDTADGGGRLVVDGTDPYQRDVDEAALRGAPEARLVGRGSTFRFRLRRVRTMGELREVQNAIQEVSRGARVPVILQGATMKFASVSGQGRAKIWVSGTATPGAEVILDVGHEEVRALVDRHGDWTAAVERSSQLRRRGGWIYALIRKGRAKQYLRMNVLDVARSDRLLHDELPPDCSLRRY